MKPESVKIKQKSQVTVPKEIMEALDLKVGDTLECRLEEGKIILVPMVSVPRDQAWFWTEEWQKEEREAEQQIKEGKLTPPMSIDKVLADLDQLSKEK